MSGPPHLNIVKSYDYVSLPHLPQNERPQVSGMTSEGLCAICNLRYKLGEAPPCILLESNQKY
jgi:hypothetical protein